MSVDFEALTYDLDAINPADGSPVQLPVTAMQNEEITGELAVRLPATVPDIMTTAGPVTQLRASGGKIELDANWAERPREEFQGTIFELARPRRGRAGADGLR